MSRYVDKAISGVVSCNRTWPLSLYCKVVEININIYSVVTICLSLVLLLLGQMQ